MFLDLTNADFKRWLAGQGWGTTGFALLDSMLVLGAALLLGILAQVVSRALIRRHMRRWVERSRTRFDDMLYKKKVFSRLSRLVPGVAVYWVAPIAFDPKSPAIELIQRVALVYILIVVATVIHSLLAAIDDYYHSLPSIGIPIKSYIQMAGLLVTLVSGVLVIAVSLNKSPLFFLSGLGAMTAVLLLVFKDALLGMVASIQLAANDLVRIGDWIEVPKYGADGEVTDITLTTVKVKNWDKTLSMLPSYALVSDAFRNWRGMQDSGGRRIKRSIPLDMSSVRHCTPEMLERMRGIQLLTSYLDRKIAEIDEYNRVHECDSTRLINGRRLTNLGVFRAYVDAYLRSQSRIRDDFTFLVRQLEPSTNGMPLEIYVFTATIQWAVYESIQADLFDHLLAVLPEFELRVLQIPGGSDVRAVADAIRPIGEGTRLPQAPGA